MSGKLLCLLVIIIAKIGSVNLKGLAWKRFSASNQLRLLFMDPSERTSTFGISLNVHLEKLILTFNRN
jgi:hypothetical protein